jgi:hypothetical protein
MALGKPHKLGFIFAAIQWGRRACLQTGLAEVETAWFTGAKEGGLPQRARSVWLSTSICVRLKVFKWGKKSSWSHGVPGSMHFRLHSSPETSLCPRPAFPEILSPGH